MSIQANGLLFSLSRPTMKHNTLITSILLFCACCWFFTGYFEYIPSYHEQHTPLFLYTSTFLESYLSAPGGITGWLTSFVAQFFIHTISAAITLGLVFTGTFALLSGINKKVFGTNDSFSLALIPIIYLLIRFFRIDFSPLMLITVSLNCIASLIWLSISQRGIKHSILCGIILLPTMYFASGIGFTILCVTMLFSIVYSLFAKQSPLPFYKQYVWSSGTLILLYLWSLFSFEIINTLTLHAESFVVKQILAPCYVVVAMFIIGSITRQLKATRFTAYFPYVSLLIYTAIGVFALTKTFDIREKRMIQAQYFADHQQWDQVLAIAKEYRGKNQLINILANIALYKTGQFETDFFSYKQSFGLESLFIPWNGANATQSLYGSLIYSELGLHGEVVRRATEAMNIEGQTPSVLNQLIVAHAANGNQFAADKFGRILNQSLFYSSKTPLRKAKNDIPNTNAQQHFINHQNIVTDLLLIHQANPNNELVQLYLTAAYILGGYHEAAAQFAQTCKSEKPNILIQNYIRKAGN